MLDASNWHKTQTRKWESRTCQGIYYTYTQIHIYKYTCRLLGLWTSPTRDETQTPGQERVKVCIKWVKVYIIHLHICILCIYIYAYLQYIHIYIYLLGLAPLAFGFLALDKSNWERENGGSGIYTFTHIQYIYTHT